MLGKKEFTMAPKTSSRDRQIMHSHIAIPRSNRCAVVNGHRNVIDNRVTVNLVFTGAVPRSLKRILREVLEAVDGPHSGLANHRLRVYAVRRKEAQKQERSP